MKIRIMSNNLRFRLGRDEVEKLGNGQRIEETLRIGDGELVFALAASGSADAQMNDRRILVVVPIQQAKSWSGSDQVGINMKLAGIEIAIEKDFKCLHGPTENEGERFPNPLAQTIR
jgi:hypothetical protein